jgi:hypothetical protein
MSGPDLNVRLTAIMKGGPSDELPPPMLLLLATLGAASLMLPVAAGMLGTLPVTPIAAKMENVLNTALPMIVPQLAPPAPRPVHHRIRTRLAPSVPVEAPVAAVPQPAAPPPSVAAQPAVITTVIKIVLPTLPAAEPADEMLCRRPETLPGKRLAGPTVCKPKSEWAQLKAQGLDIAPDGSLYRASNFEKARTLEARPCNSVGAMSASNALRVNINCF